MACQIGIVVVKDGEIVERINKLIQPPGNKYDEYTISIHHISPEITKDSPTFEKVWEEVKEYFIGTTLVAHNAQFDQDVLYRNLSYYDIMPMGIENLYVRVTYIIELVYLHCAKHSESVRRGIMMLCLMRNVVLSFISII